MAPAPFTKTQNVHVVSTIRLDPLPILELNPHNQPGAHMSGQPEVCPFSDKTQR